MGEDILRTYYIFNINKQFSNMYKNSPYKMYKILEELYHTNEYDMVLTYHVFEQIAKTFNKTILNEYLYYNLKHNTYYHKNSNIHIIANNYEYTKLVINNANLKIRSNINFSSVFKILNLYYEDLFVCDFVNKDYFWLSKILENDRHFSKNAIK